MEWIKKHLGGGEDSRAPFIVGSDKWMSSTAQHKGEKASPAAYDPSPEEKDEDETQNSKSEIYRSRSLAPPKESSLEISRSQSLGSAMRKANLSDSGRKAEMKSEKSSMYPKIYEGKSEEELANDDESLAMDLLSANEDEEDDSPIDAREECLVTVPDAMVHLVDDEQSPHLASGHFSLVRITQKGNGIVVLVRVGENLHWPLMKDESSVKLDPTHYFFSLPVPKSVEGDDGSKNSEMQIDKNEPETLNYGVTFPNAKKHEKELQQLDALLEQYSSFSSPTLVHGDEQKEKFLNKQKEVEDKESGKTVSKDFQTPDKHGGKEVPTEIVSSDGKEVVATEQNQAAFWTTMAPNVDDYGSSAARGIATGTGQIIRGIFWVSDSTVSNLDKGSIYLKSKLSPASDKPSHISPRTLRNLKRVRNMSRATEKFAKSVLSGVVKTVGFFSGAVITSRAGQKIFKLMPGEVALVSLDGFAKLFDAVEKATTDVLQTTTLMTQSLVSHRFGEAAGQMTENTLATAGHVFATAWTVSKLRKALNPKEGAKPMTKTGMVKGVARNMIKGK